MRLEGEEGDAPSVAVALLRFQAAASRYREAAEAAIQFVEEDR